MSTKIFEGFRFSMFIMTCPSAMATMIVAAMSIHSDLSLISRLAGLAIATPVLTLISLPLFLYTPVPEYSLEITSVAILWTFWLAIAAEATLVVGRLFPQGCNQSPTSLNDMDGILSSGTPSECHHLVTMAVTGYMNVAFLTTYLLGFIYYLMEGGVQELQARKKPPTNATQIELQGTTTSPQIQQPNFVTTPPRTSSAQRSPGPTFTAPNSPSSGGSNIYEGKSVCLMCRRRRKNGRFDFCGIDCRSEAQALSPLLLEVPKGHTTFTKVERKFQDSWKPAIDAPCPPVREVYRVVESAALLEAYTEYRETYGNEHFRYHGTKRSCQLGNNGYTTLCESPLCNACSIIKTSFEVTLANPAGA